MGDKTNVMVLKTFFGVREGGTLRDFVNELKELSEDEKETLAEGIRNETYTY